LATFCLSKQSSVRPGNESGRSVGTWRVEAATFATPVRGDDHLSRHVVRLPHGLHCGARLGFGRQIWAANPGSMTPSAPVDHLRPLRKRRSALSWATTKELCAGDATPRDLTDPMLLGCRGHCAPGALARSSTTEHTRREAGPQSHGTLGVSRVAEWSQHRCFGMARAGFLMAGKTSRFERQGHDVASTGWPPLGCSSFLARCSSHSLGPQPQQAQRFRSPRSPELPGRE
jgi:hypothetical protein